MYKAAIVFTGGFNTNERQIKRTERLFDELKHVHYCDRDPKAVAFSKDGVLLGQQNIDNARACPYIDPIIIQGPAWLYDGVFSLEGWNYMVDYNRNFRRNIMNAEKTLQEVVEKGVAFLIPLDKKPSESQHDYDEKIGTSIETILSGNYDFLIQMSDKAALKGLENEYDQLGWYLRDPDGNLKEWIAGNCFGEQIGRLPERFFHVIGVTYDARGMNTFNKIAYWLFNSWNNLNKWQVMKAVPAINTFRKGNLSLDEVAHLLEKVVIPRDEYRGEGKHFVLDLNTDPDFTADVDTFEEAKALDYKYTDVARLMGINWQEFRKRARIKKSTIITPETRHLASANPASSQLRHQSAHREESDSQILRADSQH